jgi:hypothetical protein
MPAQGLTQSVSRSMESRANRAGPARLRWPERLLDKRLAMAETPKLSVEKALKKLRAADAPKSKNAGLSEKTEALEDEIKRMRAQRLRLDRHQRRSTKSD